MWAPILEKAWAKVKGSYENTDDGYLINGLRAVVGAPVFNYQTVEIAAGDNSTEAEEIGRVMALLQEAEAANYVMGATTGGESGAGRNSCGLLLGHAFSVISTFELTEADGDVHSVLMLRNTVGATQYSGAWRAGDPKWTDELVA